MGAGQDLVTAFPYASAVFDAADAALQLSLTRLMWHGQQVSAAASAYEERHTRHPHVVLNPCHGCVSLCAGQSELRQTEIAQPAILTHSFAVWSIVQVSSDRQSPQRSAPSTVAELPPPLC